MVFFLTFPGSQANRIWIPRRGRGSRGSRGGGQGRVRPIRQSQDPPARLGRPKKARVAPPVRGGGTRHDPFLNPIPGPSWAMQAAAAQVPPAAAAGSAPNQDSGSRRVAVLSQNTVSQVSQSPWSPGDDLTDDMFADVGEENDVGNWN